MNALNHHRWASTCPAGTVLLTVTLLLSSLVGPAALAAETSAGTTQPAGVPEPEWADCPAGSDAALAGFQCASASVPLDYQDPAGTQITLAVVKHQATDPAQRLGTLFVNPGGPGGQGTVQVPDWIELVPSALRERFDVVSWDPRGIGQSTAVQCFASQQEEADFLGELADFPVDADQQQAYVARWAELGQRCAERNGPLLNHVSTAETARDLDRLRQAVGEERLTYLGLSYGTILGATYANLFPDRVRALVLDGNVAPAAWTNANRQQVAWNISSRIGSDTAAAFTLRSLLVQCGQVSTTDCAFSAGTAERTQAKFDALLARLRTGPVVVGSPTRSITYAHLLTGLSNGLDVVRPHDNQQIPSASMGGWPALAAALQELWLARDRSPQPRPAASPSPAGSTQPRSYAGPEQALAVVCGDTPAPPPDQYAPLAGQILERVGPIGLVSLWGDEPCASWPAQAAAAYSGPWNTATSAPILVIGNTSDPATPYQNALGMVASLANARLLTVAGYGHTTLLNPSTCANDAVVAYFVDGALPSPGTICQQDAAPFQASAGS
jgi:pimeloyl-ACP methyl ester carboxylesterase